MIIRDYAGSFPLFERVFSMALHSIEWKVFLKATKSGEEFCNLCIVLLTELLRKIWSVVENCFLNSLFLSFLNFVKYRFRPSVHYTQENRVHGCQQRYGRWL